MARHRWIEWSSATPRLPGLRAALRLARFENCLFAYAATAIGSMSARKDAPSTGRLVLSGTVAALVLGFGNVVNDLFDEDADRRSKPWRPLPSGRITRRRASDLAQGLAVAALALGMALGRVPFGFAVAMVVLGYEYSARLKGIPLAGNILVALQVGGTILFGALCAGGPTATTLIGSVLVMLYSLTLEVAKTVEDEDADRSVGVTTIAHLMTRPAQGALVVGLSEMCATAVIGAGMALDAPPGYWMVLVPLIPLAWLGTRWQITPHGAPVPVRQLLGASKALWLLAIVALATIM